MNKNNNSKASDVPNVSERKGVVEPLLKHMDFVREDILLGIQRIEDLMSVIAGHLKREHDATTEELEAIQPGLSRCER